VSIGKRLFNFARSELNSLLDRAAELGDGEEEPVDPDEMGQPPAAPGATSGSRRSGRRKVRLEDLSDAELQAEIERRKLDREINERAERPSTTTSSRSQQARSSARPPRADDPVAKAYAALEVPVGSDFETVRKAYRSMMRKYHPDRHTASPDKQKAANELAQKLTAAYDLLEKRLRK
jgi:DnaJ-domain-containing protein 1